MYEPTKDEIIDELIEIITSVYWKEVMISAETKIFHDLLIYGKDMEKILTMISEKHDHAIFDFDRKLYFPGVTLTPYFLNIIYPKYLQKWKSLTIGELSLIIIEGIKKRKNQLDSIRCTDISAIIDDIIKMLEEISSKKDTVNPDTRIFHDLKIYGDDALELLDAIAKKYNINDAIFDSSQYFPGETAVPFFIRFWSPKYLDKWKPLSVRDLATYVILGVKSYKEKKYFDI